MAKQSFFAEQRSGHNDPNFFSRMSIDEIRKSVKRIVRDIKFGNIVDQDFIYFTNPAVIGACVSESYVQFETAHTITNALNYYIVELRRGNAPYGENFNDQFRSASAEQVKQNYKACIWLYIYNRFLDIQNGADPKSTLESIRIMDFNVNAI